METSSDPRVPREEVNVECPKLRISSHFPTRKEKNSGRTTQPCNSTSLVRGTRFKKSTRLALFLYIQAHYQLDSRQLEYIAHFQAKLNLDEIQSALKFVHSLTTNPRTRARMQIGEHHTVSHNVRQVPFSRPRPKLPQQRRIGVGYRDKGSLPKNSLPSWDKENERAVSLRDGNAVFDFTAIQDLLESKDKESNEVLSRLRKNYPEASFLFKRPFLKIENPEPGVWIISQT